MERHDNKTTAGCFRGAARRLLGVGAIAAAMVAMTAGHVSAQSTQIECTPIVGGEAGTYPALCGFVFTDTTQPGDGSYDDGEGVGGVEVFVTTPGGAPVNSTYIECSDPIPCGYFTFGDWPTGDGPYLFCIPDATNPEPNCALRDDSTPVTVTLAPHGFYTEIELVPPAPPQSGPGTGTPGYWKNHLEVWPATITVGGVTYAKEPTGDEVDVKLALQYMGKVSGDKTLSMFAALISAKLNVLAGNDASCINDTVDAADLWLDTYKVGSTLKASNPAWSADSPSSGSALHQLLDDYNNGRLCAPHRN